ncbi:MAG: hypothetical protein ACRD92_01655 [Nitrosopumilaceae archaeon]
MACNIGKITKKKIIILSSIGAGIAVTMYFFFTITNNPAILVAILPLLIFAACPAMCAVCGIKWLKNRFSKNKQKNDLMVNTNDELNSTLSWEKHKKTDDISFTQKTQDSK